MKERGLFLRKGLDGTVYICFENDGTMLNLDPLLPAKLRGKNYEEAIKSNSIAQFFDLADMIFITADGWSRHRQSLDMTGITKENPIKTKLPHFDLDYLNLRSPSGDPLPKKTAEILSIVAAYWESPKDMAISFGYVALAWHRGMPATEIIKFIQDNTRKHPKTGVPELVFPKATPEEELFGALMPSDIPFAEVTKSALENLQNWISSVPREQSRLRNRQQRASDIVFLGLADFAGQQDQTAIKMAREYIWERIGKPADYKALWRHIQASKGHYPADDPNADYSAYNERIAEMYDQNADNITISETVIKLPELDVSVPTDHLCFAAWMLWQMGRSGQYGFQLQNIFNKHQANWLASDAANELLSDIFPDTGQKPEMAGKNVGRNDQCPCGSKKKFKKCCGR